MSRIACAVAILLLLGCPAPVRHPQVKKIPPKAIGPTITATVLTIHTEILPEKKAFNSLIVAADNRVRIGDELDHWRLFDLKAGTVTFVDDIGRTFRTVPADSLLRDRQRLLEVPLPDGITRATIESTGTVRQIGQWPSRQHLIRLGAYHRELWLSTAPILGENFFPLLTASSSIGEGLPGAMRDVQEELMHSSGVPVADHAEMPLGKATLIIDRQLQKIEQRPVPAAWLSIPASYRDLNLPVRGSLSDRRPVSSTPPDREAPAKE